MTLSSLFTNGFLPNFAKPLPLNRQPEQFLRSGKGKTDGRGLVNLWKLSLWTHHKELAWQQKVLSYTPIARRRKVEGGVKQTSNAFSFEYIDCDDAEPCPDLRRVAQGEDVQESMEQALVASEPMKPGDNQQRVRLRAKIYR